jgi:DNA-binding NarL/FixJ family response regulator
MKALKALNELTRQEAAVLVLVARGWRNSRIAAELVISTRTVESHLYRVFDKLGVATRTEATLVAYREGVISAEEFSGITQDAPGYGRYAKS